MAYLTTKSILKKIGCKNLSLYKGEGYWYFIYDDKKSGKFESHSVYCMYLGSDVDFWVQEGEAFVKQIGVTK